MDENGADWHQRGHFKHEDADQDGFISKKEYVLYKADDFLHRSKKIHLAVTLKKLDTDSDSQISKEEFQALTSEEPLWKKVSKEDVRIPTEDLWSQIYWMSVSDITLILD